jgi:nucleoid-associated protein YgaU
MSTRRLAVTTLGMALVGVVLGCLGPDGPVLREALTHPQRISDTAGPDTLVLAWAAALSWAVWAWGVLGLGLTAATAIPGLLGRVARTVLRGVLPAGARRAASVALGIGLGVGLTTPAFAGAATPAVTAAAPDWPSTTNAPDWPTAVATDPAPDWPTPIDGDRVVVRGDCLWDIAATHLAAHAGQPPTDVEVADAVSAWWTTNRAVIGPDPDLLLPGQVLHPPGRD